MTKMTLEKEKYGYIMSGLDKLMTQQRKKESP